MTVFSHPTAAVTNADGPLVPQTRCELTVIMTTREESYQDKRSPSRRSGSARDQGGSCQRARRSIGRCSSSKPLIPVARMPVWSEDRGKPLPADAVSCLTAEVVYQAGCWEPVPGPFIVAASTRISFRYAHGSCGRRPPSMPGGGQGAHRDT